MKFNKACRKLLDGEKLTCEHWPIPMEYIYLSGTDILSERGLPAQSMFWGYSNYKWEIYEGDVEPIKNLHFDKDPFVCSMAWSTMVGCIMFVAGIIFSTLRN